MLIFKQVSPSAAWVITHNGVSLPSVSVTVLHNGQQKMIYPASVEVVDNVTIKVTFSQPFAGTAIVRSGGGV